MRRSRLAALLFFGLAASPAAAFAESEGAPAEGHGGAEHVQCTASSSDEECAEYWESHINWWNTDYKKSPEQRPEHRHMPPPFGLALVNFAVFAFIMYRLAARPLREFTASRHLTIKKELHEAAALRRAAEEKLREYQAKLDGVESEIDKLVASIRTEAEAEKRRMLAAAEIEAARIKKDAETQIAGEIARLERELRREVVDAAVAAAESLLRSKTSADDQRKLFDNYLTQLEAPASAPRS